MAGESPGLRVLYSFPHPLGSPGVGTTALNQVRGLIAEGCQVSLSCTSTAMPVTGLERLRQTLVVAGRRVPHRALGVRRARAYHDLRTSRLLGRLARDIDLVHCWPSGSRRTLRAARRLGIPAVREVPNTHTEHAFAVAERERLSLGIDIVDRRGSHTPDPRRLAVERQEYELAQMLLVPSPYVARTFLDRGFRAEKLGRHQYGCDLSRFFPPTEPRPVDRVGLSALFVGRCEPRKGLHHALRAWVDSGAAERGRFVIAGSFVPGYRDRLVDLLRHPSIEERGFTEDVAELMRDADVLVLPSLEEGSALVTYEAQACGVVLAVSEAAGALCTHEVHGLVHQPGDLAELTEHLARLDREPGLLVRLREATLDHRDELSWATAAKRLVALYRTNLQQAE